MVNICKNLQVTYKRLSQVCLYYTTPVVTLPTEDNIKVLKQVQSGFKRTINQNKCQSKLEDREQNKDFDSLIDASFQGVNRLFYGLKIRLIEKYT